jgi:hypothetical protein
MPNTPGGGLSRTARVGGRGARSSSPSVAPRHRRAYVVRPARRLRAADGGGGVGASAPLLVRVNQLGKILRCLDLEVHACDSPAAVHSQLLGLCRGKSPQVQPASDQIIIRRADCSAYGSER